jgi:hypothetical protein
MDIRYFAQRSQLFAATHGRSAAAADKDPVNNASPAARTVQNAQGATPAVATPAVAVTEAAKDSTPATEGTAQQPATLPRFSPAGRLLNVLQSFEQQHPEETKQALSNIADKLRADSEHAGVFSDRLNKWADRFQQAAETGDLSNLVPRQQAHFGLRAYQQNAQPAPEADETVEHVAGVAARHASTTPAAKGSVIATNANEAASSTAPQKSTLGDDQGAADMRGNQSPPIIVADRLASTATQ